MNPVLIARAIHSINGEISLDEFALASSLGRSVAKDLLIFLASNGIGSIDNDTVLFKEGDRVRAAILAIEMGIDPEAIARSLNWRDFERLVVSMLIQSGYETYHSLRFKRPRAEIDVVGLRNELALLIDCKHWRYRSGALKRTAEMQIRRAEIFMQSKIFAVNVSIPVILTLYPQPLIFAENVPIVPVSKLNNFIDKVTGYMDKIRVVR